MGRMRVSKLENKCEEAIQIPEQREILQTLLEHSNLGHNELRRKAGIQSDDVYDKHLKILIENRIVLEKRMPKVHAQRVFYKVNPEAEPIVRRLLTPSIVESVLERFRLLFCRDPDEREVATWAAITPNEAQEELYKHAPQTAWKLPTEQDRLLAKDRAYRRLELAAWIKLGCREAGYVKGVSQKETEFKRQELEKADKILKMYAEYVPKIEAYRFKGESDEKFYYRLIWPEPAVCIIGDSLARTAVSKEGWIGPSRQVPTGQFKECLEVLRRIIRIKIHCIRCGYPFEEKLNYCPQCGVPATAGPLKGFRKPTTIPSK
jgi:hypothetical protein